MRVANFETLFLEGKCAVRCKLQYWRKKEVLGDVKFGPIRCLIGIAGPTHLSWAAHRHL